MMYLIVHPILAYPLDHGRFFCESAFCTHLRALRDLLHPTFDCFVLAGVRMSEETYRERQGGLAEINEAEDRIRFVALISEDASHPRFLIKEAPAALGNLWELVRKAGLLHSGYSLEVLRPIEMWAMSIAWLLGRPTLGVVDIDYRKDVEMSRALGRLGLRKYLFESRLYEPIRRAQLALLARRASLLLVKEESLVRDYARPGRNVRLILDPGYEAEHVVSPEALERKLARVFDPSTSLEVCYFGRLTAYKGVDRMIEAARRATDRGARFRLTIMGVGPERAALAARVERLNLAGLVRFEPPIPYGEPFFRRLRDWDLLLAAPLAGDTPRSAWDALASGMGILAFDTPFYRMLARRTGAVRVVPWPDAEGLGAAIAELEQDRATLAELQRAAVRAARLESQTTWLARRAAWTLELVSQGRYVAGRPGPQVAEAERSD